MLETLTGFEENFIQYFDFNASIRKPSVCPENMLLSLRTYAINRSIDEQAVLLLLNIYEDSEC